MRIIQFLLVFLGAAVLVVGSIFWINRDTFISVFQNRAAILEGSEWVEKTYSLGGLIEFMAEQPDHAALFSGPVDMNESHDSPENSGTPVEIRHGSHRIVPGGTLNNIFLLVAYAEQKQNGEIDPGSPVDSEKLQPFYIPGIDRRHQRKFTSWADEHESGPSLQQLVSYLVTSNDPAVADYLFFRLGEEYIFELASEYGGELIEPPVPQFGLRMTALNQTETRTLSGILSELHDKDREDLLNEAVAVARDQWNDPKPVEEKSVNAFRDQRDLHGLYPRLQPDRFAGLLSKIWTGGFISEDISRSLRKMLFTPVEDRLMKPHVTEFAAQFDERMGYMNGWSIARPADDEQPLRVQVIMITDIPAGLWFHMNSNFMIRDFHNRMLYDSSMQNRAFRMLEDNGSESHTLYLQ